MHLGESLGTVLLAHFGEMVQRNRLLRSAVPYFRTRTRPSWMLDLKKSFTEHPARPEEAQAHAHAQEDAQAQEDAHEEAQEEWWELCDPEDRVVVWDLLAGVFTTFTRI